MSVSPIGARLRKLLNGLSLLRRPEVLVFLPLAMLGGYWLGGEGLLVGLALGLPVILMLLPPFRPLAVLGEDGETPISRAIAALDDALPVLISAGRTTACLVVQFDDLHLILERHGRAAQAEVLARAGDRIRGTLRLGDTVSRLQGDSLAIVLTPVRRLDLEAMVQMSVRLQEALAEPVSLGGAQLYVSASVGFCIAGRAHRLTGASLLDAAQMAADEARRLGPGTIRAYSPDMARRQATRSALRDSLEEALDRGEIRPYFQPQICTETGEISGFESLARWHHPERGCLMPADFLPVVESGDLCDRLGEVMLTQSLQALAAWDVDGLHVPSIAVNFSASELRNPRLPEKIRRELDRFALTPERLTVEILETVVAQTENDMIVSNIAALARLGCGVDMDDFGTGHASILTIRRFAVRRLKIDRSFITRVDEDRDQQRMVSAIVSLADRLGLGTLAEGVETSGEHAMLCQLGCGHVQGFGLAHPMPRDEAGPWIRRHQSRPDRIPRIGLRSR